MFISGLFLLPMKILHIFNDWKWTGPSEPILNLCSGLIKSGEIVHLACPVRNEAVEEIITYQKVLHPIHKNASNGLKMQQCLATACLQAPTSDSSGRNLPDKAKESGIKTLLLSPLPKYFPFLAIAQNIKKLTGYISSEQGFDIIHCHSSIDHFYSYRVRRHYKNIKIIRTNHKGFPLELSYSNKFLLKYATDGYIALSKNLAEIDCKNFSLVPPCGIATIGGAVDIRPEIKSGDNLRSELGLKKDDIVIGVVARVQRHRRFNIIIEAMRLVVKEMPSVKLLIIGRGTHYDELVTEPVKELNLGDNVISAGYRSSKTPLHLQPVRSEDSSEENELRQRFISDVLNTSNGARKDDYFDIINILDFGVYLVPGSDGSCRAALELMAAGKPLIVARRGVLPEIVDDNRSGLVIDDTPENLAQAILHLAKDKELLDRFSEQARLKMAKEFSPELSVKATTDFYHKVSKL
ncbi:MAG: glycosyltransferase family 4 protein [Planctomycetota bacterium]